MRLTRRRVPAGEARRRSSAVAAPQGWKSSPPPPRRLIRWLTARIFRAGEGSSTEYEELTKSGRWRDGANLAMRGASLAFARAPDGHGCGEKQAPGLRAPRI